MYANTTSTYPTHFLAAISLIEKARGDFQLSSENWPYPTETKLGTPDDEYYAEVWVDGMDWQHNYLVIEAVDFSEPVVHPLMRFESHEEQDKFNDFDFRALIKAMLRFRRNEKWVKRKDYRSDHDTVWAFLKCVGRGDKLFFNKYAFEHASQPLVIFEANPDFTRPESYKKAIL
jgi:hypothetical protein